MQVSDPLNTLAFALNSAIASDLPSREYEHRGEKHTMRPRRDNVDVTLFLQDWSSTALGFDVGMAGQAFCSAYTAVVTFDRTACVYFGEGFAYSVDTRNQAFIEDLGNRNLASQSEAAKRYSARRPARQAI